MSIFCDECGYKNDDDSIFCERCGAKLSKDEDFVNSGEPHKPGKPQKPEKQQKTGKPSKPGKPKKSNNKNSTAKIVAIVLLALAVVAAAVFFIVKSNGDKKNEEYNAKIAEAEDFRNEGELDKAIQAYLDAIDIDPTKEAAYFPLSEIYLEQKQYYKADSILQDGIDQTGSSKLKSQKKITEQYVALNDYFVATYKNKIAVTNETLIQRSNIGGALSMLMDDYNNDGYPEMLVVSYNDTSSSSIELKLFNAIDNDVNTIGDAEYYVNDSSYLASKAAVFIKENGSTKYLCIKGHNVPSFEEGVSTFCIYDLANGLKQLEDLMYYATVGEFGFYDGAETVAFYSDEAYIFDDWDDDGDVSEMKKDRSKEEQKGLTAMDERLKLYGFRASSIKNDIFPKYYSDDKTQIGICYIVNGDFDSHGNVNYEKRNRVFLEDYTNMIQQIKVYS